MRKFDTKVQYLKYKVLKEVSKEMWNGTLTENLLDIPKQIIPGKIPTMRCCVYKERAILAERVKIALGGNKEKKSIVEVIDIACDECPIGGYEVTNACRGCLAHRCEDVCKFGAITFDDNHVSHIDKTKCKECGACSKACPYGAIRNYKRPCETACKVKAISKGPEGNAVIDDEKCTSCGACVYACPFGALTDKSFITEVIDIIKNSDNNKKYKVIAVVAPSISSQFVYATTGQVVSGLKELGFSDVIEAALGADIVAKNESKELVEKGKLLSSCCPAFVTFIENKFKDLVPYISSNLSPMATIGKYLKEKYKNCKVIFIGPCTAKKNEARKDEIKKYIDSVLTFEELQALFDSREIDITTLNESDLHDASYFGRIFARCGGLSEAVKEGLIEQNVKDFELNPISCDGIEECNTALLKLSKNLSNANFIEGMACINGCSGGSGCLTHGDKNIALVNKFSEEADNKTILESVNKLKNE